MRAENQRLYRGFFENGKRQYIVPVYQRNYDWRFKECKKIFDDIRIAWKNDVDYFIGSIIRVEQGESEDVYLSIIVDGQQRLTTIYLFLKALLDSETNSDRRDVLRDNLINNFKGYDDYNPDKLIKIKLNPVDNQQLKYLINNEYDLMNKESNIYKNYFYFKSLIKQSANLYQPNDLKSALTKLVCVTVSLDPKDDAQLIFESINSTGIPLELDDLIRNHLLMTNSNQEELYEKYWRKIEDNITKDRRADFFLTFLRGKTNFTINKKNAFDTFKNYLEHESLDKEKMLEEFSSFSKYYGNFIGLKKSYSVVINDNLEKLRRIDQSTVFTFLLMIFDDFENKVIDEEMLDQILKLLISYSVRRIASGISSSGLNTFYRNLYNRAILSGNKNLNHYYRLVNFLINNQKNTGFSFPNNENFERNLLTYKIYLNGIICRFLLEELENYNSKEKIDFNQKDISIEHILPQNFQNQIWRKDLGDEYIDTYGTYLHTLGNLTLTGYNSSLSDRSFDEKKGLLKEKASKMQYLNQDILSADMWSKTSIEKRSKRLSIRIIEMFKYPEIVSNDTRFDGTDINPHFMITLDDYDDVTGMKPIRLELNNKSFEVKSFKEALSKTMDEMYEIDPQTIEELAISNYSPTTSNNPYFSKIKSDLRSPVLIDKSKDVYFETNLSSKSIMGFIDALFNQSESGFADFQIICTN